MKMIKSKRPNLTMEQKNVFDFLEFIHETKDPYPYLIAYEKTTIQNINDIIISCDGQTDDIMILDSVCRIILNEKNA